ncbi:hypothetical protein ACHAWC_007978, partial [Mediolabrus comicus]
MATTSNLFVALAAVLSSNTAAAFSGIVHRQNHLHHHRSRTHITDVVDVIRTPTRLLVASNRDRSSQRRRSGGYDSRQTGRGDDGYSTYDAFGDYDDDGGMYYGDDDGDGSNFDDAHQHQHQRQHQQYKQINNERSSSPSSTTPPPSSTFYSKKPLSDPNFSITTEQQFFQQLCHSAKITRPSRIQSLAWPSLLRGHNTIVADQTGSGKTLAYLLPLIQKLHLSDMNIMEQSNNTQLKKLRMGSPRILILTPTAELADQIHTVCSSLSKELSSSSSSSSTSWTFNPFVTTATGSHSTNIRDQIRMLQTSPVDVLISTPGRLATILRTKNSGLDLGHVQSLVLDEVDFLLVDETFGPQLRTVGVAVNQGGGGGEDGSSGNNSKNGDGPQFIFVTATLPEDVLESIQSEFPNVTQLRGPGLHRTSPSVHQSLIDVSVPASSNRDQRACFDIKIREMFKALRSRRCNKTLIFCNTVETCRNVENALKRKDKRRRRNKVWAYHNALSPEVRLKNLHSFSTAGGGESGAYGDDDGDDGLECILVCTDRAARGIDFDASPIDHVLLFDFPKDPAEY